MMKALFKPVVVMLEDFQEFITSLLAEYGYKPKSPKQILEEVKKAEVIKNLQVLNKKEKVLKEQKKVAIKNKIDIVKAKSFIIKLFSLLSEFCKGIVAIYTVIKIIVEIIKLITNGKNYVLLYIKSRMDELLLVK